MYLKYYGFRKAPFEVTPDPRFLFLSPSHKEALASVLYGIGERKGFISITGEVGSGKTTILKAILSKVNPEHVKIAYVFDPELTFEELIWTIFDELELGEPGPDIHRAVHRLHQYLIDAYRHKQLVVLFIDEAQRVPPETLERLGILSNLETTRRKLVQIVLCGQFELDQLLARHNLRQLRERIAVRSTIKQLTRKESVDYIQYRLRHAGQGRTPIFSPFALRKIIGYAKGNPRTLNIVCDNALVTGYAKDEKPVSWWSVRETIAELSPRRFMPLRMRLAAGAAALVIVVSLVLSLTFGFPGVSQNSKAPASREHPSATDTSSIPLVRHQSDLGHSAD